MTAAEKSTGERRSELEVGQAIAISALLKPHTRVAATVATTCEDEILLDLLRPTSQLPFQEGEQVRIKYWDGGSIIYCWEAEVVKIAGPGDPHVAISIRGTGITMQRRRAYRRVDLPIPFSFSVIDVAETELIGEKVLQSTTQNISVAGLRFETSLRLEVGDKLEMNLHLPDSQSVNVVGCVVRSEPAEQPGKNLNSVAVQFLQWEEQDQIRLVDFLAQ